MIFNRLTFRLVGAACLLSVVCSAPASAAIVNFSGILNGGGLSPTPLLGNIPAPDPARSYSASINFTESTGLIDSGTLSISGIASPFSFSSGSIFVSGLTTTDSATLIADFTGVAPGSLTANIVTGNTISNNLTSLANLNTLLANVSSFSSLSLEFTGPSAGTYNGSVAAVPEPSSGLLCAASLLVAAFRCRRNRRQS